MEITSAPYAPMSHPFIERVTGTIQREYLDHAPIWNSLDLAQKLEQFKDYCNSHRTHEARSGQSPSSFYQRSAKKLANTNDYKLRQDYRGLFQATVPIEIRIRHPHGIFSPILRLIRLIYRVTTLCRYGWMRVHRISSTRLFGYWNDRSTC